MRKQLHTLVITGLVMIQACAISKENVIVRQTNTQSENIQVKTANEVPSECITESKEFIAYILRDKPDIADDKEAQNRWLSESLRKGLANRQETYKEHLKNISETDNPGTPPGNRSFVGAWDYPTTFKIEGSRLYNKRAIVDISFSWGKGTNYEGDTRLVSYIFKLEGDACKLDDIYTFEGEFTSASSLNEEFKHPTFP